MSVGSGDRALRKRVLILRAAVERAQLAGNVEQLREAVSLPRMLGASLSKVGVAGAASTAFALYRKYPLFGTVLSVAIRQLGRLVSGARPAPRGRSLSRAALGGAVKLGGAAAVGWLAWRWWQRQRPPRNAEYR